MQRVLKSTALVALSAISIGAAAAIVEPAETHRTLIWVSEEAMGHHDSIAPLFLFLAALGLACGLTLAVAGGLFALLRRRSG